MPKFAKGYLITAAAIFISVTIATLMGVYGMGKDIVVLFTNPSFTVAEYSVAAVATADRQPAERSDTPAVMALALKADDVPAKPFAGSGSISFSKRYTLAGAALMPNPTAISYLIGDIETGEIIAARFETHKMPIASITKLVTSLVTLDMLPLGTSIRISARAVRTYGDEGRLSAATRLPVAELLYPLLLESSNDAAEALAEAAGREQFIRNMNAKAEEIGMHSTFFDDPSGLSPRNVSTTEDLFALARFIMREKPAIFHISLAPSRTYGRHEWRNVSKFITNSSYLGGKVGYTDEAGKTIVTAWDADFDAGGRRKVAIILLDSEDNRKDILALLDYLKKNVQYQPESVP